MNPSKPGLGKRLWAVLQPPLSAEQRTGYYRSVMQSYFWPTILVGVVIMLLETGMIVISLVRTSMVGGSPARNVHLALYVILFLLTLACSSAAMVFRSVMDKKPVLFMLLTDLYGLAICLWGSYMAGFAHRNSTDISVYIYVSLCVAIVVNYSLWQAVLVFGANLAFFYIIMFHFLSPELDSFGSVVNSLIVALLCITISGMLHRSRVLAYLNRITIEQQNEQISSINAQLRSLVLTDNLTGAYNRRYLDEVLPNWVQQLQTEDRPSTVLMIDIDHFKQYNDIYGHQDGDVCLQSIAETIMALADEKHGSFVRYGGEEFVLFLPDFQQEEGRAFAEITRAAIENLEMEHRGSNWGLVTISIGVFALMQKDITIHQAVHNADLALYTAKNAGRNQVQVYDGQMQEPPTPNR